MSKLNKIKRIINIIKGKDIRPPKIFVIIDGKCIEKDRQDKVRECDSIINITFAEKFL